MRFVSVRMRKRSRGSHRCRNSPTCDVPCSETPLSDMIRWLHTRRRFACQFVLQVHTFGALEMLDSTFYLKHFFIILFNILFSSLFNICTQHLFQHFFHNFLQHFVQHFIQNFIQHIEDNVLFKILFNVLFQCWMQHFIQHFLQYFTL